MSVIHRRRAQGAVLITAIFLITTMAVVGVVLTRISTTSTISSALEYKSAVALYAAESGIDRAAYEIQFNNTDCSQTFNGSVKQASFSVSVSCLMDLGVGSRVYEVVSTGTAGTSQRTITVQFMP